MWALWVGPVVFIQVTEWVNVMKKSVMERELGGGPGIYVFPTLNIDLKIQKFLGNLTPIISEIYKIFCLKIPHFS